MEKATPAHALKVGDRVVVLTSYSPLIVGAKGTIIDRNLVELDDKFDNVGYPAGNGKTHKIIGGRTTVKKLAPSLVSKPTIASDLSLKPQAKSVLRHLRGHGYITPMQSQIVYGIMRLAACVYELRQVGYDVKTAIKADEHGHRYSRYELTVN